SPAIRSERAATETAAALRGLSATRASALFGVGGFAAHDTESVAGDVGEQCGVADCDAAFETVVKRCVRRRCPPASSAYAHVGYLDAGRRLEVRQQIRIASVRVIACGARIVQLLLALQVAKVRHHGLLVRLLTRRTELRNRDGGQDADD